MNRIRSINSSPVDGSSPTGPDRSPNEQNHRDRSQSSLRGWNRRSPIPNGESRTERDPGPEHRLAVIAEQDYRVLRLVCDPRTNPLKIGNREQGSGEFLTTQLHLSLTHGITPTAFREMADKGNRAA